MCLHPCPRPTFFNYPVVALCILLNFMLPLVKYEVKKRKWNGNDFMSHDTKYYMASYVYIPFNNTTFKCICPTATFQFQHVASTTLAITSTLLHLLCINANISTLLY